MSNLIGRTSRGPQSITTVLVLLLVWLPLQTPIAIIAYQYLHVPVHVDQAILLLKDAAVALLILAIAARTLVRAQFRLSALPWASVRWFDWLALLYVALLVVYSIVPWLLGSKLPLAAVAISFRDFLIPVELYALGRLAFAGGADVDRVTLWFLAVAFVTAVVSVALYLFVPVQFWQTTLDLVTFERNVQGIGTAFTLWDISILGQYGSGTAGSFARAVGPFTHPVGTGHYFVAPLVLAIAGLFLLLRRGDRRATLTAAVVVVVLSAAVITPISRGSWIAAVLAAGFTAVVYRRMVATGVALAVVAAFLVVTPPFKYSISSAVDRSDSSVAGHTSAISHGIDVVTHDPTGLGVGQSDTPGAALAGDAGASGAGVGENMYLALLVAVGPLGFLVFVGWMVGVAATLIPRRRRDIYWVDIGVLASLGGYAVSAMTASPLMRFTTGASFWLLLGLAVARRVQQRRPSLIAALRGLSFRRTPESPAPATFDSN